LTRLHHVRRLRELANGLCRPFPLHIARWVHPGCPMDIAQTLPAVLCRPATSESHQWSVRPVKPEVSVWSCTQAHWRCRATQNIGGCTGEQGSGTAMDLVGRRRRPWSLHERVAERPNASLKRTVLSRGGKSSCHPVQSIDVPTTKCRTPGRPSAAKRRVCRTSQAAATSGQTSDAHGICVCR